MTEIQGTREPAYGAVRDALAKLLEQDDVGASAAVFVGGEPVVDLWGGYADADRTTPWRRDTVTNVMSTTKTMAALCALMLADRGQLDLAAPVARYWPEFAAAGKEGVLVRHVLSHSAGLPEWSPPLEDLATLYDWPASTALLAAQEPAWEPGTDLGYHSVTFGHLIGELVRRVDGRLLSRFFAEEVAGPLGADFHFGLAPEHDHRLAPPIPPVGRTDDFASAPDAGTADGSAFTVIRLRDAKSEAWRRAELPAVGGYGNARSVALAQSALANGGEVQGVRLLSAEGCAPAWTEEIQGTDRLIGVPMTYTAGFGRFGNTFGWGGWGGSLVMSDPGARMTVAYVMNQMADAQARPDNRGLEIVMAAYDGLR